MRDNQRKIEDYSPFSVSILRSDDYEEYYSPTVGDEEVNPFANILPDFSERLGRFFDRLANSTKAKNKSKEEENDENINLNDDLGVSKDKNNRSKELLSFVAEPEEFQMGSSSSNANRNINNNGTSVRIGLVNRLTNSPIERSPTNNSNS